MQPTYTRLKKTGDVDLFIEGLPESIESLKAILNQYPKDTRKLVVLDDLMQSCTSIVSVLFTQVAHHMSTSVIYLSQNLFFQKKEYRDISLNSHYLIVMKNARDRSQILSLAKQISPGNTNFVLKAYEKATKKPHSYLLVDSHPTQNDALQLRSNLFSSYENPVSVFVLNKDIGK